MKLRHETINYLETELIFFHDTKKEIQRMRMDIIKQSRSSTGDESIRSSSKSDPTSRIAIELASNSRLERMERIVMIIDSVVGRIQPDKLRLIELMYWSRPRVYTWQGAAIKLHITKRTAFRWRKEIIHAIADRGGFI